MNWQNSKELILFIIAVWGATLSTFNWWQARTQNKRVVKMSHGYAYGFDDGSFGPSYLEVKATNAGHRPVTVTTLTLQTPNKKWMGNSIDLPAGMVDTKRPATLSDGQTASAYFLVAAIRSGLRRQGLPPKTHVIPLAKDSIGNTYMGDPIEIDLNDMD